MSTFRSKLNLSILIRKRGNPGLGLREICRIVWGVPGPGETEKFYSTFQRRWTEAVEGYQLLIDSHYSHIFNYCYMSIMYTRNVKVMALEAHSSHFSQPLDKNPFSCFKHAFNKAMRRFNRQNGGRPIRKDEFFSVFNVAWQKAMTPENIKAGFKRTGLWPVNKDVFPKEMFRISENSECID